MAREAYAVAICCRLRVDMLPPLYVDATISRYAMPFRAVLRCFCSFADMPIAALRRFHADRQVYNDTQATLMLHV